MWILSSLCFLFRYNVLVRHLPDNANNIKCQQMLLKFDPQAKDWQMGHSKVCVCVCVHARACTCTCMCVYIRAYDNGQSPDIFFLAKISICPATSNLTRQIYYTLSMEKSLSLLKIIKVHTIFSPYHKH